MIITTIRGAATVAVLIAALALLLAGCEEMTPEPRTSKPAEEEQPVLPTQSDDFEPCPLSITDWGGADSVALQIDPPDPEHLLLPLEPYTTRNLRRYPGGSFYGTRHTLSVSGGTKSQIGLTVFMQRQDYQYQSPPDDFPTEDAPIVEFVTSVSPQNYAGFPLQNGDGTVLLTVPFDNFYGIFTSNPPIGGWFKAVYMYAQVVGDVHFSRVHCYGAYTMRATAGAIDWDKIPKHQLNIWRFNSVGPGKLAGTVEVELGTYAATVPRIEPVMEIPTRRSIHKPRALPNKANKVAHVGTCQYPWGFTDIKVVPSPADPWGRSLMTARRYRERDRIP